MVTLRDDHAARQLSTLPTARALAGRYGGAGLSFKLSFSSDSRMLSSKSTRTWISVPTAASTRCLIGRSGGGTG